MAKIITNGELAAVITSMLTNPKDSTIDDSDVFCKFMTDLSKVVCEYAGGVIVNDASVSTDSVQGDFSGLYMVGVHKDENVPENSIWDAFDKEADW